MIIQEVVTEKKVLDAVAKQMATARKNAGLTLREASELSGCSQQTIVNVEKTGIATTKVLAKLCTIYNHSIIK